jgi:hypothetical protein
MGFRRSRPLQAGPVVPVVPLAPVALVALLALTLMTECHRAIPADDAPAAASNTTAASLAPGSPDPAKDLVYVCPMDRDIRSNGPGKCPRCGMALVAGIPDPSEFHLDLSVTPTPPRPNQPVHLTFEVFDPWKDNPVKKFTTVHEKLFHAFIVSRDLQFFVHDHPVWDGSAFQYDITLPRPGMYRILGDFYPEAATPQLLNQTLFIAGDEPAAAPLARDYSAKQADNLTVSVSINPADPIVGVPTQIRFTLSPADGIQKYLGAWAHMLVASDDLIDMIHTHPLLADGTPEMQFSIVFPRQRNYRMWVQFQRNGVVNTAHFDIPVKAPEPSHLD